MGEGTVPNVIYTFLKLFLLVPPVMAVSIVLLLAVMQRQAYHRLSHKLHFSTMPNSPLDYQSLKQKYNRKSCLEIPEDSPFPQKSFQESSLCYISYQRGIRKSITKNANIAFSLKVFKFARRVHSKTFSKWKTC